MILGELFYYNKTLDELSIPLDLDKNLDIELAGLPNLSTKELRIFDEIEARRVVRDRFAMSYTEVLVSNQLFSAAEFWSALISPKKAKIKSQAVSEFQKSLLDWLENGNNLDNLQDLLKDAQYSNDESDFSLYYGLKVLLKFSTRSQNHARVDKNHSVNIHESKTDTFVGELKPQIIVLTQDHFSPLFLNLNCVYCPLSTDKALTLQNIDKELILHSDIKMILINKNDSDLLKYLHKHLPSDVLVSSFELENQNTENYFDTITKKTLGIKLITE
jgi:hypothetical protein